METSRQAKLELREQLTKLLLSEPLDPRHYISRAQCYLDLQYPDLAAGDAHKALELVETSLDDTYSDYPPEIWNQESQTFVSFDLENFEEDLSTLRVSCFYLLSRCCSLLGCFQDSAHFLRRAEELDEYPQFSVRFRETKELFVRQYAKVDPNNAPFVLVNDRSDLRNVGTARREIYDWNNHEPERSSAEVLQFLNSRLETVAPLLEVKSTALPILHNSPGDPSHEDVTEAEEISVQLGLFAREHLSPGLKILHEPSLLNACRTLHSPLCDCCQSPLPSLSSLEPPKSCPSCSDTVFCSESCLSLAQETYHPAVCDNEEGLEEIGRDPNSQTPDHDLYLLLLARVIAMSETRETHPLDLPETRYIWGDFSTLSTKTELPFTFSHAVVLPHRILTAMGISPFAPQSLTRYDTWIFQTLYAKFRGVASAKQSTWDGKPEVAAVHPLWCLANHSCDPNIKWEWPAPASSETKAEHESQNRGPEDENVGSGIVMTVRTQDERAVWGDARPGDANEWTGIKPGEEILNHYCDIRLPVKERREWAMGALGGACMCKRCQWEAREVEK